MPPPGFNQHLGLGEAVEDLTVEQFIAHGRSDSQLPIETSAVPHAKKLLDSGYDLTLLPFDGDHVIVPWVVERAVDFFLGPQLTAV